MVANAFTTQFNTLALHLPQSVRRWLPLVALLVLALIPRLSTMADPGYRGDLRHFAYWMRVIEQQGVFNFYNPELRFGVWDRTYPPLSMLGFSALINIYGFTPEPIISLNLPDFVVLLKLFPVAAELGLVAAVYFWLDPRSRLRWIIPALIAISPGLIATSAWWGQYDSPFTLFLVLALMCLNRDRAILAWLMFGIAVMLKQPALVMAPLLLIVTFRRYGWRLTAKSIAASGALCGLILAPFVVGSGVFNAMSPYLKAGDAYPYLSNNAYNTWYALASLHKGAHVLFEEAQYRDSISLLGGITFKHLGLFLLGGFVILGMGVFWRQGRERREFVWAAALFFGFFMLPTQVHERYLYPAAVFTLIAIAQERRLGWAALGITVTFAYNILAVLIPNQWRGTLLAPERLALPMALANVGLFLFVVLWTVLPHLRRQETADGLPETAVVNPALNTLTDIG